MRKKNMITEKKVEMNNGLYIPVLGYGTWLIEDNDEAAKCVKWAIELGYRHIDTAEAYGNEEGVGRGIKQSGIPRGDIFLTTKLRAEHKDYYTAKEAIDESLKKLGLDYIDLMIIHSPQPWDKFRQNKRSYDEGNREAWRALEDAQKDGKIASIGISNFEEEDIDNILSCCTIKPAINQIKAHIGNMPTSLIRYAKSYGILTEAYSPIAHGKALLSSGIQEMAKKYGVTPAQLCIKYSLERCAVSLPKTANKNRMKENMQVDFSLSNEDLDKLDKVVYNDYGEFSFFPVFSGK